MHTTTESSPIESSRARAKSQALRPLLAALLLGSVVIYAAGFLPTAVAHNAAHDSRHSHVFPCH
ncbi:CbtB domain-containing protein [Aestuariirhabdus litorea]|uniref:CbtB-domain containing protein n=1 Tax=Aestuariirhabdus litorea TaxID=2528527 RepID=A0A3P3VRC4_9GAMM|nr:CbtB domain-containing protein [Aestuariirhabdus litorea]RRJ84528.1 CbtB-domain containing protein [Aestuariirhabdus litorea]RWW97753.1 CbtB-domain containing protein [Endozoicomonadaceae bacterium GTF-13]